MWRRLPSVSRKRLTGDEHKGRTLDKFEREAPSFFDRVRNSYLERAAEAPQRFRIIDSTRTVEAVRAELSSHLERLDAGQGAHPNR